MVANAGGIIPTVLTHLGSHPTQSMMAREWFMDCTPHILINRNWDEMLDTATIQSTNLFLPMLSGYGLDVAFNKLQNLIHPVETALEKNWFRFGKSLAIFGFIASIPIANAFFRNYLTARRTGTDKFIEIIGEAEQHQPNEKKLEKKLNGYRNTILKILGAGAAVSVGLFGLTQLAMRRKIPFKGLVATLDRFKIKLGKHTYEDGLSLVDGKFDNFAKSLTTSVLFWGVPIYVGLFSALRDNFELKETLLRAGAFLLSFFIGPRAIKNFTEQHAPQMLTKALGSAKNVGIAAEFFSTVVLMSSLPPLINIYLTKKRVADMKADKNTQPSPETPSVKNSPASPFLQQGVFQHPQYPLTLHPVLIAAPTGSVNPFERASEAHG